MNDDLKRTMQGGLSDGVAKSQHYREYTSREYTSRSDGVPCFPVWGYYGSSSRTNKRDQLIEKYLREEQGLSDEGISHWLSSGRGRHLMDNVDNKTTLKEFKELVQGCAGDAFLRVTIWSHPDHAGTLSSTIALQERLKKAIKNDLLR